MASELKTKTENDLIKMLNDKRVALREFYFNLSGSKTRNVKEGREIKKDIARVLTEMHFRRQK